MGLCHGSCWSDTRVGITIPASAGDPCPSGSWQKMRVTKGWALRVRVKDPHCASHRQAIQSSHLFFLRLFKLHQSKTQKVFNPDCFIHRGVFPFSLWQLWVFTKPLKEATDKTWGTEISVTKCDEVLVLNVPVAFGGTAQKSPALRRQTLLAL